MSPLLSASLMRNFAMLSFTSFSNLCLCLFQQNRAAASQRGREIIVSFQASRRNCAAGSPPSLPPAAAKARKFCQWTLTDLSCLLDFEKSSPQLGSYAKRRPRGGACLRRCMERGARKRVVQAAANLYKNHDAPLYHGGRKRFSWRLHVACRSEGR